MTLTVDALVSEGGINSGSASLDAHGSRHNPGGADAVTTAAPVTIGTANAEGAATSLARSNHVHDHGSQTTGTHHAAVTTSVNGFMSAADKTILDRLRTGFLQYNNSADATTSVVTFTDLVLDTNLGSFANGFFTKLSTTEFRADFNGRVRLHYSVTAYEAGNNRGFSVQAVLNGTLIPNTLRQSISSSTTARGHIGHSQIVQVATNDIIKLQFASTVATQVTTIEAGYASLLLEIYSLGVT